MKTLRKVCAAALLACVLAVSTSAGEIHTPTVTAPPPPPDTPPASASVGEATGEAGDFNLDAIVTLLSGLLTML